VQRHQTLNFGVQLGEFFMMLNHSSRKIFQAPRNTIRPLSHLFTQGSYFGFVPCTQLLQAFLQPFKLLANCGIRTRALPRKALDGEQESRGALSQLTEDSGHRFLLAAPRFEGISFHRRGVLLKQL